MFSNKKLLALTAGVGAALAAVAISTGGAQAAAPLGAPIQSDYSVCTGNAGPNAALGGGGGYLTCELDDVIDWSPDAVALTQIIGPAGGRVNLPANTRFLSWVINAGSGASTADDIITGVNLRVFGHQMVLDPNGNYRANEYSGGLSLFLKVTSNTDYCEGNACS
jgi:hypothetical protein